MIVWMSQQPSFEQLEALITRFFSSARPAAAASRAPLDNRQRYGAVLVPGAECTRRRDEIQKESSFSQGPSVDGTKCQERRQCDPGGADEPKNCTRLDKRPFALTMDVSYLCLFRRTWQSEILSAISWESAVRNESLRITIGKPAMGRTPEMLKERQSMG